MKLGRLRTMTVAASLIALLAACTPGAENGPTVSATPAPVPAPASIRMDPSAAPFRIDRQVAVTGDADAAAALGALLRARTGPTGWSERPADGSRTIELRIEHGDAAESYRLTADAASVVVTGADAAGLFYGVQTLGQLIARDGSGFLVPAVRIVDAPRFAYRGVMLDVARHFHSVPTVTAYIDRAASLKFNALHLHLSDDQGWRIQLESRPELTERASGTAVGGDAGGFYTAADYRRIVEHAASRHMIVVPEVDMPGHTHAVGLAYPELAADPVLSPGILAVSAEHGGGVPTAGEPYTGMAVGFSSLKIHEPATYRFVADVVGELAAMTPGPYLHIGGDEALGTDAADYALFVERATRMVADAGKIPVTWHEAGAAAGIDPSTVGQYWGFRTPAGRSGQHARAFAGDGAGLILSPADAIYLDMKYDADTDLGLTWADGPTSVERAYSWEPTAIIDGVGESDILGVEAPLWSETIRTPEDIDRMAFPRLAAAAEAAWSPAAGELRTWESFRTRVGALGPLWTGLGIRFHASPEIPWVAE